MTSDGIAGERRKSPEPSSERIGIFEVKLSDVTAHTENASRRSDAKMHDVTQRMEAKMRNTSGMVLVNAQINGINSTIHEMRFEGERKRQVFQIRKHAKKRIKRENNNNPCHGCRGKISAKKTVIHHVLHEPKAPNTAHEDNIEPREETSNCRRTDGDQNMRKWISQGPKLAKHRERSRRIHR